MNVKGTEKRGSMTELRQNVSAVFLIAFGALWTSSVLPRPFFLVADDSRGCGAQLESCGSHLGLAEQISAKRTIRLTFGLEKLSWISLNGKSLLRINRGSSSPAALPKGKALFAMKLLLALLAVTTAIRNGAPHNPMPRSQPTTLETLRGHDPFIDIRGGGIFDDPDEEPEEDDVDARMRSGMQKAVAMMRGCLLYTSPSPRDQRGSRMPSSA